MQPAYSHHAKPPTSSESVQVMRRLIACMPASRFEMQTFCRLAGIEMTRSLPTAAVECTRRPRLLINPDFVAKYCQRDEHLFLLVMHELWHVMLAHTRMYPRMTPVQNIAFDAIINAGLMREFSTPEYSGFFDVINPADKFPSCLLRPPVGWPHDPQYPDVGPQGTKDMIRRLYPRNNVRLYDMPLYEEVLALLMKSDIEWFKEMPMLLGNHDGEPEHDPIFKDMMRQVREKWPHQQIFEPNIQPRLRDQQCLVDAPRDNGAKRIFANILRACITPRTGRERQRRKVNLNMMGGSGVLPNPYDRLAPAKARLGAPDMLWAQPTQVKARQSDKPSKASVYLDVSGSMNEVLGQMMGLLLPYVANHQADVFQFSTRIEPLSFAELREGALKTTGGTSINAVFEHLMSLPTKPQRVLLLTDGDVGLPEAQYLHALAEHKIRLYVVLSYGGFLHHVIEKLAAGVVSLPRL